MYIYTYEVYERRVKSTMGVGHVKGGGHKWVGEGERDVWSWVAADSIG